MKLLQLQQYDFHGNNAGGCYINPTQIVAITKRTDDEPGCLIYTTHSTFPFNIVQSVAEVLDLLTN